jgi:hypothetical protein
MDRSDSDQPMGCLWNIREAHPLYDTPLGSERVRETGGLFVSQTQIDRSR